MRKLLIATPLIVLIPLLGMSVGGCASASKAKAADQPALVIPLPPPHVVPITPEPVLEPVSELPGATSTPSSTPATRSGRGARDTRPPGNDVKPDTKPPDVP